MEKVDLESINSMDGYAFEDLIGNLFIKMGFAIEQTKKTADGGIDLFAYSAKAVVGGKYIIQCKRMNSPIPEATIRDLYGVVTAQKANKGILITNSTFSSASIKFAEDKPLELINGDKLINLIAKYFNLEQTSPERKISLFQELLLKGILKKITHLKKEHVAIGAGLVFKKGKRIQDIQRYRDLVKEKSSNLGKFIDILNNLLAKCNEHSSDENLNISQQITPIINIFGDFLEEFFSDYESVYFSKNPDGYENVHSAMLNIYDSIFSSVFSWAYLVNDVLESPEKHVTPEGKVHLSLVINHNFIAENCEFIAKELNKPQGGACFIATACYGYNSKAVFTLKQFRDNFLLVNGIGKLLVKFYYKFSPGIAYKIREHAGLKKIIRVLLNPIVYFANKKIGRDQLLKTKYVQNEKRRILRK
ncbi:restriction endonuclease [bacterium]|nr:restriction endonuclease [bacterium]